jgi:hypothetical protein
LLRVVVVIHVQAFYGEIVVKLQIRVNWEGRGASISIDFRIRLERKRVLFSSTQPRKAGESQTR